MNTKQNIDPDYNLLKVLENSPDLTQRQMAGEVGLSLGKLNYCLKALIKKGFVKVERFTTSNNKAGYLYILTPHGIEERSRLAIRFLKRKMEEFEELKLQIEELRVDVKRGE